MNTHLTDAQVDAACKKLRAMIEAAEASNQAGEDAVVKAAMASDLFKALVNLSNEVLGSLPLMEEPARREFGNTNYNILIQRAEEARAAVSKAEGR